MNEIPSRNLNPFSVCWVSPGRIPYFFDMGLSIEDLVARLRASGWRGEIVGPHGAGKSTLLAALEPCVQAERTVCRFVVERGQRRLPRIDVTAALRTQCPLLIIDGYDELAAWYRRWLRRQVVSAGAGLLVTSHAPTGLPHLLKVTPKLELVLKLVHHLVQQHDHNIPEDEVAASFSRHGGNVREILFDLYDRYEHNRRSPRTFVGVGSY
jgi:hypothetical protein